MALGSALSDELREVIGIVLSDILRIRAIEFDQLRVLLGHHFGATICFGLGFPGLVDGDDCGFALPFSVKCEVSPSS